ncbi:hypothetical protein ACFYW9_41085 [Streptomyces sp. NPDC002698]|uniref:hypothetical protein n=1 Tax=Streptomyces sp. NPDC002698 TaxID=3364660 RepID=UPI0036B33DF1
MNERQTPADLRAAAERSLVAPGKKRLKAVAALKALDAELEPLVVEALRNEVSALRISELTGIHRNTIRAIKARGTQ